MRDVSKAVPFGQATRGIFALALEGMLWTRRTLLMAVLLCLPVAFGVLYRVVLAARMPPALTPLDLYGTIVVSFYLAKLLPLTALFYATALVADEVEGKTITYLLTRPIPRAAILAGKFASYLATTLALTLPSIVITFFLLATARGIEGVAASVPDLFRDLSVISLGLLAYGALFALFGVLLRRPMIPGLLFAFGWELMHLLPGYLPRLTLIAYLQSLVRHRPAEEGLFGLFLQTQPADLSLAVLMGASAAFLAAAIWIFSRREYVLDQ
jgi:ABC-type transport system involved in multi-copper enzyme maturation permease subunit